MEYRLDELFDLQMGKTPSRNTPEYWNSEDHKWISIGDLSKCGKYIYETKEYISDKAVKESGINQIPANTVIMGFKLSIGKTAITHEPMYSNEAIMSFRDKKVVPILPDYIYYMFSGKDWNEGTNKAVMGKTLNKATLSGIRIKVHSLSEQQEIILVLDKAKAIIEARQQELQKLDNLIKARFVEMFGDEKNTQFLDKLTTKITDGSHNPPKGIEKSEFLMLSSQNVWEELDLNDVRYLTKEDFEIENRRTNIADGDVLLTIVGTIGKTHVVQKGEKYVFQRSVAIIKPINNLLDGVYLSSFLKTNDAISQLEKSGHGSSQKGIYLQDLKKLMIPVPDIEKQIEFRNFAKQVDKSKLAVQFIEFILII